MAVTVPETITLLTTIIPLEDAVEAVRHEGPDAWWAMCDGGTVPALLINLEDLIHAFTTSELTDDHFST